MLDNQSTLDIFCNPNLIDNITEQDESITIYTNGGEVTTNYKGTLEGYGDVWYHPNAITNILSLNNVRKNHRVTYDSSDRDRFIVHKPDRLVYFDRSNSGLCYHNTNNRHMSLVQTEEENSLQYSKRDYENAKKARKIYETLGYPSKDDFKNLIKNNMLYNCPITISDIETAEDIFGPDIGALKGKVTRTKPAPVSTNYIEIPDNIFKKYKNVVLCCDTMYIQQIPFFVTVSRHIRFITISELPNKKKETYLQILLLIKNLYESKGFKINTCLMDMEYKLMENDLKMNNINLNLASPNEHVPEVERTIRTIKERVRAIYNRLPYSRIPKLMMIELVNYAVTWLNNFPPKGGVSATLSPRTIFTGINLDYNKHCKIEFGAYAQVHDETSPTNTTTPRTTGAIALGSTYNQQGGYKFLNLNTGKIIHRRSFTAVPATKDVIARVEQFALKENRPHILSFEHDIPMDEENKISENSDISDPENNDDFEITGVEEQQDNFDNSENSEQEVNLEETENFFPDEEELEELEPETEELFPHANIDEFAEIQENENNISENTFPDENITQETVNNPENNNTYTTRSGRKIIKPNSYSPSFKNEKYDTSNANIENKSINISMAQVLFKIIDHFAFQQYGLKAGIRKFGEAGKLAAYKELEQLHLRNVFDPLYGNKISFDDKQNALDSLIFIKEKENGDLKGRACADGRKQRGKIDETETTSPTVSLESVLLTAVIEAKEGRDVAVLDIPNAFVQTDMEGEQVLMKMKGDLAELMVTTAPQLYRKYLITEKGQPVLYVKLLKALYGCLKSALLFYKKLVKDLINEGFEINPYDPCVANKIINGKQFTVVWHVDDLKISHADEDEISKFIEWIKSKYQDDEIGKVKTSRGKVHKYLGMTLDYSISGKVQIKMLDYIKEMINAFPEEITRETNTPAGAHLFNVRKNNISLLVEEKATTFHTITAKGLFVCKRARPDIQTVIEVLTTRVQEPDNDDWLKLKRLIEYLNTTKDLYLTLEADNTNILKWYIDASYAVRLDMKSHTGGALIMGKGAVYSTSVKQKLNVKSSTEAELVGADDVLSQVLWTNYFLETQ